MKKLSNIHPGEILQEEFLIPLEISAYRLSQSTSIPQTRISEIIKGRRRITCGVRTEKARKGAPENFTLFKIYFLASHRKEIPNCFKDN